MLTSSPEVGEMVIREVNDSTSLAMSPMARQFAQPWWLHPRRTDAAATPRSRDARRDFTAMATQIGLAAWMLGTALTSACVPADLVGGAAAAAARLDWLPLSPAVTQAPAPDARIPVAVVTATPVVAASAPGSH
jgi:hypothetical protein